jgi:pyruvate dehydrogenase E1 component alpha subunit
MEYTPIADVTAVEHPAADRAAAYGLERIVIDGNDPDEVGRTADLHVWRARAGEGPALIEALTYRHGGHSRADSGAYRPKEEVAEWLARDPIPTYRARLLADGVDEAELLTIEAEAAAAVDEAEAIASSAPESDVAELETQVWSDGGSAWRN